VSDGILTAALLGFQVRNVRDLPPRRSTVGDVTEGPDTAADRGLEFVKLADLPGLASPRSSGSWPKPDFPAPTATSR
jgi:hypothetical protein